MPDLVDLVIATCLIAQPGTCRDQHLYFESYGSLQRCMMEAMPHVAQWSGEHPQWRVVRFHCQFAGNTGRDI